MKITKAIKITVLKSIASVINPFARNGLIGLTDKAQAVFYDIILEDLKKLDLENIKIIEDPFPELKGDRLLLQIEYIRKFFRKNKEELERNWFK